MGTETFNYIDSLNTANPASTDNVSEGDDHIRGIKTTLKNTFPNLDGAVNATDTELNYVDGVTSAIQTQLDSKQASATAVTKTSSSIPLSFSIQVLEFFQQVQQHNETVHLVLVI